VQSAQRVPNGDTRRDVAAGIVFENPAALGVVPRGVV
jgi:hypothetical protein